MDSARLGRVLGAGARGAARTLFAAADAAAAPSPQAAASHTATPASASASGAVSSPRSAAPPERTRPAAGAGTAAQPTGSHGVPPAAVDRKSNVVRQAVRTSAGLAEGTRRFNSAVAQPVRRLSGVLWLEFTGVFFGLFAVSAAVGAWRLYGGLHAGGESLPARNHFLFAAVIAVVFAYFCISSFLRARRRSRQT